MKLPTRSKPYQVQHKLVYTLLILRVNRRITVQYTVVVPEVLAPNTCFYSALLQDANNELSCRICIDPPCKPKPNTGMQTESKPVPCSAELHPTAFSTFLSHYPPSPAWKTKKMNAWQCCTQSRPYQPFYAEHQRFWV